MKTCTTLSVFLFFYSSFYNFYTSDAYLVFDLSHELNNQTLKRPPATQFKVIPVFKGYSHPELPENDEKNYWLEINDIEGAEHTGTHIDAPSHFAKGEWTVAQIPLDHFFGPVSIIDLRGKVKDNADYEITENDLAEWERMNQRKLDPLIILWTGWGSRFPDSLRYLGTESETDTSLQHFPGLSKGAAEWIVKHGGIHGVGIDTASIDSGQSTNPHAHKILLSNKIFFIESVNTKDLESFPIFRPYLMVAPLKITGGSGSPVRALLLSQLPKDSYADSYYMNSATKMKNTNSQLFLVIISLVFCQSFFSAFLRSGN